MVKSTPPLPMRKITGISRPPLALNIDCMQSLTTTPRKSNPSVTIKEQHCGVAMSKSETVLLSATGDILVCRCRLSSKPYQRVPRQWSNIGVEQNAQTSQPSGGESWFDATSKTYSKIADSYSNSLCPCNVNESLVTNPSDVQSYDASAWPQPRTRGGLLGGTSYQGDASDMRSSKVNHRARSHSFEQQHQLNPASSNDSSEDELLLPLPSFDYSHYSNGGNDMIPSSPERGKRRSDTRNKKDPSIQNMHPLESNPPQIARFTNPYADDGDSVPSPIMMHGVPTFLPALSQIRITKVSAHPLGSHVLLISSEALLFSYGLNNHGQLGNGKNSLEGGPNSGFVTNPTIVTPLLENGGKAISCAAGIDHSLVVVETDGKRVRHLKETKVSREFTEPKKNGKVGLNRTISSPPRLNTERDGSDSSPSSPGSSSLPGTSSELVFHHQLYGFGKNNCMKLGLAKPNVKGSIEDKGDVLLPRRVALHCKVWPGTAGDPPAGIFQIAASEDHSAALVRRSTGAIEIYTWGNASDGALGLTVPEPPAQILERVSIDGIHAQLAPQVVSIPTMVDSLSYVPSFGIAGHPERTGQRSTPISTRQVSLRSSTCVSAEYPEHVWLGPKCTFVLTSKGRCVTFGTSENGLLGLGPGITTVREPTDFILPGCTSAIKSVSAGSCHAVALTQDGSVYSWGSSSNGRLGVQIKNPEPPVETEISSAECKNIGPLPENASKRSLAASSLLKNDIVWLPQRVQVQSRQVSGSLAKMKRVSSVGNAMASCNLKETATIVSQKEDTGKIFHACAGYDSTILVTDSGRVLSCGEKSGRLGVGEVHSDVLTPKPLFGGLRLWQPPHDVVRSTGNSHDQ